MRKENEKRAAKGLPPLEALRKPRKKQGSKQEGPKRASTRASARKRKAADASMGANKRRRSVRKPRAKRTAVDDESPDDESSDEEKTGNQKRISKHPWSESESEAPSESESAKDSESEPANEPASPAGGDGSGDDGGGAKPRRRSAVPAPPVVGVAKAATADEGRTGRRGQRGAKRKNWPGEMAVAAGSVVEDAEAVGSGSGTRLKATAHATADGGTHAEAPPKEANEGKLRQSLRTRRASSKPAQPEAAQGNAAAASQSGAAEVIINNHFDYKLVVQARIPAFGSDRSL